MKRLPLVAVVGPTASGKSGLALELARRLNGEIVSADSAQVYRGLSLGTAKPTEAERAEIPHHLLDLCDPDEFFSVADFQTLARHALEDVAGRGRLPLLVGGTGLYVRALVRGYTLPAEATPDPELREQLNRTPLPELLAELERVDPVGYARVDRHNPRRVVRAVEVFRQTGVPFSANYQTRDTGLDALWLALRWPQQRLDERIAERTRAMLDAGFLEEVRSLAENGYGPSLRRLKLIGYPELLDVVEGRLSLEEAVELLERSTRRYARRQLKWFRREKDIHWLDAERDVVEQALAAIREWREKDAEPPGRVSGPA